MSGRHRFHTSGVFWAAAALAVACDPNVNGEVGDAVATVRSALQPSQCSGVSPCADMLAEDSDMGRFPGGVIRYRFHPTFIAKEKNLVQLAMEDFTRVSGGAVTFVEVGDSVPSTTYAPIVSIQNGDPHGPGFHECTERGGCALVVDQDKAYHEIKHTLGFVHSHQRNDRIHYLSIHGGGQAGHDCNYSSDWTRWPSGVYDYGPFDYFSSVAYGGPYPQFARWNGQPLLATTTCGVLDETPTPVCPPGDVSSIFCSTCAEGSTRLFGGDANRPADTACRARRPAGMPSKGDGASIAELYRNLAEPGWRKFVRTSNYLTATSPAKAALATGVSLPSTASPAVTAQPSTGTSRFFVTGSNGRVYMKSSAALGTWTDLGAPSGSGVLTDPAVTSWSSSRMDLVVTRKDASTSGDSSAVYIRSSVTSGDSWTSGWGSLGTPGLAASAPAITSWGSNRLDVVVRGQDNRLYRRRCTASCSGSSGSWGPWGAIEGAETVRGKPAVVSRSSGSFDVVVQNTSGQLLMSTNTNDAWSAWTTLDLSSLPNGRLKHDASCPDCTSPAVGAREAATTEVYVRAEDDKVWLARCTSGTCTSFVPLGGVLSSSPASPSKSWNDGRGYLVAAMPEERDPGVFVHDVWLKLYDARHFQPTRLAVYPNADGRLEVLYNGVADAIYRKWQPSWATSVLPRTDPFNVAQKIAVARNQNGKLEAFYTTPNKELRHTWQTSPGSEYLPSYSMDGYVVNDFAVTENADGRLQMVLTDTADVLYSVYQVNPNDAWSPLAHLNLPGHKAKRITLARNGHDHLEALYIGTDDVIYQTAQESPSGLSWNGQRAIVSASTKAKRIAVVKNKVAPVGLLEMFFIGTDDVLYRTGETSPGSSTWPTAVWLGALTDKAKELSVGVNEDGRVEVFYIGLDDVLYHTWQTTPGGSTWFGQQFLWDAGMTAKQLAVAANADGRLELFFVGLNDVLYHIWQVEKNSSWLVPAAL
jgi:hypothetical protein